MEEFQSGYPMTISRRSFVLLSLSASAQRFLGQDQGIATRNIAAQAKPAPSGRPFYAQFTDVAKEAGLHAPVIYGGIESKKYIMEANGCGCAFRSEERSEEKRVW